MQVVLDIKNASSLKKPKENHIILYDGDKWYVTTREALFKEYEAKVDGKLKAIQEFKEQIEKDVAEFKQQVSSSVYTMSDLVEKLYQK